jgi:hypothetical protein
VRCDLSCFRSICTTQIANELLSRTQRVSIIAAGQGGGTTVTELVRPDCDADIERTLVDHIARMHAAWGTESVGTVTANV